MAVVLSSEESYFSSSLRRSYSSANFGPKQSTFRTSSSTSCLNDYGHSVQIASGSVTSSAPSSPRLGHADSTDLSSYSSTPVTSVSADESCHGVDGLGPFYHEEDLMLAQYGHSAFPPPMEDLEAPLSPGTGDSYTASPNDAETSTTPSRPESPALKQAEDDTAVRAQPSRHVDYLSHNWKEEEIWTCWQYITSNRKEVTNSARLENASWRTWMKSKNNLSTVSPETLNWLKDCDVTWLYGPLQTNRAAARLTGSSNSQPEPSSVGLSRSNSLVNIKKPILKKRSMSEIMLQRSLSSSSLVKQAAAAVKAQQEENSCRLRPGLGRAHTDRPAPAQPLSSRDNTSLCSDASSGVESPTSERKHIHFNEQVSQCIAVEVKVEDDDDDDLESDRFGYDSDSEDEGIMIKPTTPRKPKPTRTKIKTHTCFESKTIAMLPSTTLKYREDTPEPSETAMKHSVFRSPLISPSSSQETLRPSKSSKKMFYVDEDEDGEDDEDLPNPPVGFRSPVPSSTQLNSAAGPSNFHRSASSGSLTAEPEGMRRTPSGMFMPVEDGDANLVNDGLFGRVIDTVNTARDIAHVIWNVGWRK